MTLMNLKKLVKNKNIGVIKMEVKRNFKPKDDFSKSKKLSYKEQYCFNF